MTLSIRTIPSILSSKIHVKWFYKLNENSITDSNQEPIGSRPNLNHKILFFSASLSTLKAIQHELNKNSLLSRRNFRELNSLKILFLLPLSSNNSLFLFTSFFLGVCSICTVTVKGMDCKALCSCASSWKDGNDILLSIGVTCDTLGLVFSRLYITSGQEVSV